MNNKKLQELMAATVLDLFSEQGGKEYNIKVRIPGNLANVIEYVSAFYKISLEEYIGILATDGIQLQLQEIMKNGLKQSSEIFNKKADINDPLNIMKKLGIDTSQVEGSMNQLSTLSEQIKNMTETLTNALSSEGNSDNSKVNSK